MDCTSHCPDCLRPKAAQNLCQHCGFDAKNYQHHPHVLPVFATLADGKYRIGRVLGQIGGFGVVYAGIQSPLERSVAIKEFFPHRANPLATRMADGITVTPTTGREIQFNDWHQQFLHEARLLGKLTHPRIVTVYDVLEANGTVYLVMQRLRGVTLAEHLGGFIHTPTGLTTERRLLKEDVRPLLLALLDALKYLHHHPDGPIIHLDITPNNLFLLNQDPRQPTILDFGLARSSKGAAVYPIVTGVGDPGFMAPEQLQTNCQVAITPAADCYSLGACLYTIITGIAPPPARARLDGIGLPHLTRISPGIDQELADIIKWCLQLDPAKRPRDAGIIDSRLAAATIIPIFIDQPVNSVNTDEPTSSVNTAVVASSDVATPSAPDTIRIVIPEPPQIIAPPASIVPKQTSPTKPTVRAIPPRRKIITITVTAMTVIAVGGVIIAGMWWFSNCAASYQLHTEGTATAKQTGLMWQRCSQGQKWRDTTCIGTPKKFTWNAIMPKGKQRHWPTFAGYNDWRVPTIDELHSIVSCLNTSHRPTTWQESCFQEHGDTTNAKPTIDTNIFPATPLTWFWTASIGTVGSNIKNTRKNVQVLNFIDGGGYWTNRTNAGSVRLVRNDHKVATGWCRYLPTFMQK